ncbi:hypothetical protein CAAN1_08S05380 [[Candida] anglica]|uniref:Zn(2)-C6 fungal-type domain-containing protein n=1 Tax=[Candida] anglica TaxID=148631 RepID=A0ABP0E5I6_9ASCO
MTDVCAAKRPASVPKSKTAPKNKTINAPGSSTVRVAQACDRCRAKKTKCDGKLPTCSSCAAVGFQCIVSDKLSRRAFPKGYTETLEERIRQLEAENKKLTGLLDLRDEQVSMLNSGIRDAAAEEHSSAQNNHPSLAANTTSNLNSSSILTDANRSTTSDPTLNVQHPNMLTSSNLSLLVSQQRDSLHSHMHDHHDGVPCSCSDFPSHVHERPVSIAGSFYENTNNPASIAGSIQLSDAEDNDSLLSYDDMKSIEHSSANFGKLYENRGVSPAPGAFAAATAIAQMQRNRDKPQPTVEFNDASKQQMLTSLVAVSIPRSTEETLFIPTLLAKICQVYGYNSKPAILTANAIASIKESSHDATRKSADFQSDFNKNLLSLITNRYDVTQLPDAEAIYFVQELLHLPTSRIDLDHLITVYFQDWGNVFPILDKNLFLKNYVKFTNILEMGISYMVKDETSSYESLEKFGATLVLVTSLSILSNKSGNTSQYSTNMEHFDYLIQEFIKPNCIITQSCSIQSLQILTLALQYCLVIGDITKCYELRGRVISMAQQLRLHRCPAAVLGISGGNDPNNVHLQNFRQGERRILFWCIYSLDVYSSLNLGVPRLLKDFEVECAIPFAGNVDDTADDNVNILIVNNTKLSIVGKVSKLSLSVMLYCKVLANILDSIFSRYESGDQHSKTLSRERMLDCWRRELPKELKFEMDVNGLALTNNKDPTAAIDSNIWKNYSRQQLTLIFLYYHAKILIYLPVISKFGNNHNVGLSQKEQLLKPKGDFSTNVVSSTSLIQQSSIQMLEILKTMASFAQSPYLLPLPMNLAREQARLSLLVARGSLDYVKNGPLYQNSRSLLLETVTALNTDSEYNGPGGLTKTSVKLLELAILSILGLNLNKSLASKKKIISTMGSRPREQKVTYSEEYLGKRVSPSMPTANAPLQSSKLSLVRSASNDRASHLEVKTEGTLPSAHTSINTTIPSPPQMVKVESDDEYPSLSGLDQGTDDSNEMNDANDALDSILEFDPFKINMHPDLMMNEFAADGSLGLVPFLDMNSEGNHGMYTMDTTDELWN